jgi:hypothetical protein
MWTAQRVVRNWHYGRVGSFSRSGDSAIEVTYRTHWISRALSQILGIEIDPLGGHPLEIDLTLRALPDFAMATGSLSPMHNRHTSALIDNDHVVLLVMQSSAGEVSQHGRTATVGEGEAVLTANGTVACQSR